MLSPQPNRSAGAFGHRYDAFERVSEARLELKRLGPGERMPIAIEQANADGLGHKARAFHRPQIGVEQCAHRKRLPRRDRCRRNNPQITIDRDALREHERHQADGSYTGQQEPQ